MTYVNVTGAPVHTGEGAMVAPGAQTPDNFDAKAPHNALLIDAGQLVRSDLQGVDPQPLEAAEAEPVVAEQATDPEPATEPEPAAEPQTDNTAQRKPRRTQGAKA